MNVTRRDFLGKGGLSVGALMAAGVVPLHGKTPPRLMDTRDRRAVRFGIVTDVHYSSRKKWSNRHFCDSLAKMRKAVDVFNGGKLDFVIELGDMKDMGVKPDRSETLGFLDVIESEFSRFSGPRYHALGNHDMDCISKEDFLLHTENHGAAKGKSYYSFEIGGLKFVVLDACFNKDMTPYCCGNFNWTKAFLPEEELAWLDEELKRATGQVVVFCHQLLDGFSMQVGAPRSIFVSDWKKVVAIMEKYGNVIASIQGHHHDGHYSFRNGIHYWTMKGMITGAYPSHNSYAIVEVSPDGDVAIKGFGDTASMFLGRSAHKGDERDSPHSVKS
jgi:alkaline phosphatase